MSSRTYARWAVLVALVLALVIGPWLVWGSRIENWVSQLLVEPVGPAYVAVWIVGLLVADVFLPVPSSIVAVGAGVLLGFGVGTLAAFVGLTLGSLLGYAFGAKWGPAAAKKVVGELEWTRAEVWARRFGAGLVLVLRPVPILAEASTFYAGAGGVPVARFLAVSGLGNLVISAVYASVGSFSADSGELEPALMAGFLLPGAAMLAVRLATRKRDQS